MWECVRALSGASGGFFLFLTPFLPVPAADARQSRGGAAPANARAAACMHRRIACMSMGIGGDDVVFGRGNAVRDVESNWRAGFEATFR